MLRGDRTRSVAVRLATRPTDPQLP